MEENHHHDHHHSATGIYETMHSFEVGNAYKIHSFIKKVLEENLIKQNENKKYDLSHHLKAYNDYNELSKEKQAKYILDYFRSEVGYTLIHMMFLAHRKNFKGIIDIYHNQGVKRILKKFGISTNFNRKRDIDLIRFLEDIYINTASYIEKWLSQNPTLQKSSREEYLSFHLVSGSLKSKNALEDLDKIMKEDEEEYS